MAEAKTQIFLNIWMVESIIRWVYYDFKYKSVYFYPILKLLWKEPWKPDFLL